MLAAPDALESYFIAKDGWDFGFDSVSECAQQGHVVSITRGPD